jgi:hypothetical protein
MIGNLFTAIMLTTGFVGACMLLAVGIHYLAVFHDWLKIREYLNHSKAVKK